MNQKNCLQASPDIVRLISLFVMWENYLPETSLPRIESESDNNSSY